MLSIKKKINELYVTKGVTISFPFKGDQKRIEYKVWHIYGDAMQITAVLKSINHPCEIPEMETIKITLDNEFPTRKLINQIKNDKHTSIIPRST
jgi:hypothetical protein